MGKLIFLEDRMGKETEDINVKTKMEDYIRKSVIRTRCV